MFFPVPMRVRKDQRRQEKELELQQKRKKEKQKKERKERKAELGALRRRGMKARPWGRRSPTGNNL